MQTAAVRPLDVPLEGRRRPSIAWYSILGIPVSVASDVTEALERVDETYAAFRSFPGDGETALRFDLRLVDGGRAFLVVDPDGVKRHRPDAQSALVDLLGAIVAALLARLRSQGIYAIHAGAVVRDGRVMILAGRSGCGKTTLVLGLLRRGFGLLSDELAVVEPATKRILPYRRSLHIRPGTPELVPELSFLQELPQCRLGGGIEWALTPRRLERALPGCLAQAAPLSHVLLLEGVPSASGAASITPVPPALAAMELLRGTWAASVDFAGGLDRVGRLLGDVSCARLEVGALEPTLDRVVEWLEASDGR